MPPAQPPAPHQRTGCKAGRGPQRMEGTPLQPGCWGGSTPAPPVPQKLVSCPGGAFTGALLQFSAAPSFLLHRTCTPQPHTDPSSPEPPAGPSHLRAERCLLVEVAVHELAVLPRRDLTAGHRAGSGLARSRAHSLHPPGHPTPTTSHPQDPTASLSFPGTARGARRCPEPVPTSVPAAHLPLVPMQQGRPLIWQSMCAKPVWLVLVS